MKAISLNEWNERVPLEEATYVAIFPICAGGKVPTILRLTKDRDEVETGGSLWWWDRDTEHPTIRSSIRSAYPNGHESHYVLTDGMCKHLFDSDPRFAGMTVPLVEADESLFPVAARAV